MPENLREMRHIKFEFRPKVSEVYSMSLNVEKYMQDRQVNPLSQDAKNTPSIYICIIQQNMQRQNTTVNQANRSTLLDNEILTIHWVMWTNLLKRWQNTAAIK
jgi:hypothetical protein